MHIELRHLAAHAVESLILAEQPNAERYLLGVQRYENNGIGMGHTQVIWENGIEAWYPVAIGEKLYLMVGNVHGGGWIATQAELKAVNKHCNILNIPKTANSFTRVRAAGWNMCVGWCRRRARENAGERAATRLTRDA